MGDSIVDRDAKDQQKFGQFLEDLAEELRNTCNSIKNHVNDSRDDIQHDNAKSALDDIETCADEILKRLSDISEFGMEQKKKALIIQQAEEIKFSRQ